MPRISEKDVFTDQTARDAGFTNAFWLQAFNAQFAAADAEPDDNMEKYFAPRRLRLPHNGQDFDVYVRVQEHPREFPVFRFSAFHAQDNPEEFLPDDMPLGQAAILDQNFRW